MVPEVSWNPKSMSLNDLIHRYADFDVEDVSFDCFVTSCASVQWEQQPWTW